ncbi:RsmD family RNA methyltransferase [Jonquetella anthropi]|nr:RsmD family RNA methyltransferase [Jonquetella anthropi]
MRPTTGKTLLALASILGPMSGRRFLDLFSGSGRVAETMRDRGADVVTVETVRSRAAAIQARLGNNSHLCLALDVRRALKWLSKHAQTFDVIFADPPYNAGWMETLPGILAGYPELLRDGGCVILEHQADESVHLEKTAWVQTDERRYGISCLTFLRRRGEGE